MSDYCKDCEQRYDGCENECFGRAEYEHRKNQKKIINDFDIESEENYE